MSYFTCPAEPVCLTEHLQGTRKSGQKKNCIPSGTDLGKTLNEARGV